jgi:tetratricopeptide (TPR) repeat protein
LPLVGLSYINLDSLNIEFVPAIRAPGLHLKRDPAYALAHFNLGNLYDEQGHSASALKHYQEALRLQPNYADAHYNIALLYQGLGDVLDAMRHWRAYLKLDSTSTWAHIARRELWKLEAKTVVPGSRPASAALHVVKDNGV